MITKSLKACFRPACLKRRATAALSWLDCISTVVSKTKHFRNYLFRLQHDTSTIQTSNLIQSNRTAIAENKTQQDAMSACTPASWLWCGGIVRNYIFGITFRNNTLTWLLQLLLTDDLTSSPEVGSSPPISCFKFCYEEPVCYYFSSNSTFRS